MPLLFSATLASRCRRRHAPYIIMLLLMPHFRFAATPDAHYIRYKKKKKEKDVCKSKDAVELRQPMLAAHADYGHCRHAADALSGRHYAPAPPAHVQPLSRDAAIPFRHFRCHCSCADDACRRAKICSFLLEPFSMSCRHCAIFDELVYAMPRF